MKVVTLLHPFPHTIIYDYLSSIEVENIIKEKNYLLQTFNALDLLSPGDEHHRDLIINCKTDTYNLDDIYNGKRQDSATLNIMQKIFQLYGAGCLNTYTDRNLKFMAFSNIIRTYMNVYNEGSFYKMHQDNSVLTLLTALNESQNYELQNCLTFPEFNYTPNLPHNTCIVFSSYELHEVMRLRSSTPTRISINQRLYIS